MTNQIIGLGGGGFTMEPKNPLLDLYILGAAPVKNPKICLLATASGDNPQYHYFFETVFSQYPCRPVTLETFSPTVADMEDFLLDCDIIYVGGGNTKSMLAVWREWGIDLILKQAYEKGIILAGVSAGFVCWFEQCLTDSIPNKFTAMNCLGILPGSSCPHYDGQEGRTVAYKSLIKKDILSSGYAADDGVGLHFVDGKLINCVSSRKNVAGYHVYKNNDIIKEDLITPQYLGDDENFKKYIVPQFDRDEPVLMNEES